MSIRVLVADDQSLVRGGFRMLLAGEEDIEVVAEATNGIEAVGKAERFDPDVVLMDIRMPELDGLEATRRILAADPEARVLILTTFDLDEYVYEALSAGASGFVLKDDPPGAAARRHPHRRRGRRASLARGHQARDRALRPHPAARAPAGVRRAHRPANTRSCGWSSTASPTRRSGSASTSARPPSRHTSRTSSRSSTSATVCRRSCSPTRTASSRRTTGRPAADLG